MAQTSSNRILVIDDEQVVLDAASRLLQAEGLQVVTALDAETGLAMMESTAPDLAVVDLKLPGMSGLDFMDAARSRQPDLVVILATGVSTSDQAVAALRRGAFDFLPKPFSYEELMSPIVRARRYLEMLGEGALEDPKRAGADLLFLGLQAWARREDNLLIRLGATELFQRTAGQALEIVPPRINAEIRQGAPLAHLRTDDGRWHVVPAAVGGRVVRENGRLVDEPGLLNKDPTGAAWLVIVQFSDLHRDLPNLHRIDG